jgi:hypothetical protein
MEWFAILVPAFTAVILYVIWKRSVLWWEPIIPMAATALIILIMKVTMQTFMYSDTEWWTAPIVRATYYEDWNEYIHQTCTRSCCCDSKGENCGTETYDCSYVDYHSEYWEVEDSQGRTVQVTEAEFERLTRKFGNRQFVDMNRDYYSDDGDAYTTTWPGTDATLDPLVVERSYENRVAVTNTVFQFREVDDSTKKRYGLFDYTPIHDRHLQTTLLTRLNLPGLDSAKHQMDVLNARLGPTAELKCWLIIFKGGTIQTGQLQQHLWKNGNKNEMIITIGVDANGKPIWCHPFSWTEKHDDEIRIRDWVMSKSQLRLVETVLFMHTELTDFKRKPFEEFSYLKADLTGNQLIWIWIVVILINIGAAWWIITNEFTDEQPTWKQTWNRYR